MCRPGHLNPVTQPAPNRRREPRLCGLHSHEEVIGVVMLMKLSAFSLPSTVVPVRKTSARVSHRRLRPHLHLCGRSECQRR